MTARPPVVLRARGHALVTATHAKTFELSADDAIGREASCVLGVGVTGDWEALGALMGPVAIALEAAGYRQTVQAEASPFWVRGHGLVVRKSDFRSDDTLAVNADAAAVDLDRSLVAVLADPAGELTVTIRPLGDSPRAVLFTDRLEPRVPHGLRVVGLPARDVELGPDDTVLARPGAAVSACQARLGLAGDVLLLGPLPRGKRARKEHLAEARAKAPAVALITTGEGPDDAAASAVFRPGEAVASVVLGPPQQRVNADDRVFSLLLGTSGADDDIGPLLAALLAEGVSARTLRQAIGRVPGLDRRWDYDAVQRLQ
jgi:hypothetical protein